MNTADICQWVSAACREEYEEDGNVAPVIFFLANDETLMLHLGERYEGVHPTDAFGDLISRIGKSYPWTHIACVSEAWVKEANWDDRGKYPRGTLEAQAEAGDPSVRTGVIVAAFDLANPLASHTHTSVVIGVDPLEWKIEGLDGPISGNMATAVLGGYEHASPLPDAIPVPPLSMIAEAVTVAGLSCNAMVMSHG